MLKFQYMKKGTMNTVEFQDIQELLPLMAKTQDDKLPYGVYDAEGNKIFVWNCEYLNKHKPVIYELRVQAEDGTVSKTKWDSLTALSVQVAKLERPWFICKDGEKRVLRSGNLDKIVGKAAPSEPAQPAPVQQPVIDKPTDTIEEDFKDMEAYLNTLPPIEEEEQPATPIETTEVAPEQPVETEEPVVDETEHEAEPAAETSIEEPIIVEEQPVKEEKPVADNSVASAVTECVLACMPDLVAAVLAKLNAAK